MKNEKRIFYGGWWVRDLLHRWVFKKLKCTAPDWRRYLANVRARRGGDLGEYVRPKDEYRRRLVKRWLERGAA